MKTESTRGNHSTTIQNDVQLLLGCFLAIASTGAMVMTLQNLMHDWVSKALAFIAGVALQGCMYLFANNRNYRVRAFSLVLVGFSVVATTWFMESTWQHLRLQQTIENNLQANQSWEANQIRQQIEELNREINISTTSAEIDINSTYRDRGNNTLSENDRKKLERDELMEKLNNITDTAPLNTDTSVFEETAPLRIGLFGFISLIIDISAILAFGSLVKPVVVESDQPDPQPQQPVYRQPLPYPAKPLVQPQELQPEPQQEEKPDHLGTILARIRAGEYGEFVPVKQIVESEPVRHPELKAGIDQLMEEGVLIKSGNRYRHADFEKQPELCMS